VNLDKKMIAAMRRHLRETNAQYQRGVFLEIPRLQWPAELTRAKENRVRVLRSRDFFVQVFEKEGITRLSINRTSLDGGGAWKGDITWDELWEVKSQCGYGDVDAVEAYPKDGDLVNVANIRHLWIVPEEWTRFFWRAGKGTQL
jgi:hypothetical protein